MMTTLQIELPIHLAAFLLQVAEQEGSTVNQLILEAIEHQYPKNLETTPEELAELKRRVGKFDQDLAEGKMIPQEEARQRMQAFLAKYEVTE